MCEMLTNAAGTLASKLLPKALRTLEVSIRMPVKFSILLNLASPFVFKDRGWSGYFSFLYSVLTANRLNSDQMPRLAAPDLGLHWLQSSF